MPFASVDALSAQIPTLGTCEAVCLEACGGDTFQLKVCVLIGQWTENGLVTPMVLPTVSRDVHLSALRVPAVVDNEMTMVGKEGDDIKLTAGAES